MLNPIKTFFFSGRCNHWSESRFELEVPVQQKLRHCLKLKYFKNNNLGLTAEWQTGVSFSSGWIWCYWNQWSIRTTALDVVQLGLVNWKEELQLCEKCAEILYNLQPELILKICLYVWGLDNVLWGWGEEEWVFRHWSCDHFRRRKAKTNSSPYRSSLVKNPSISSVWNCESSSDRAQTFDLS